MLIRYIYKFKFMQKSNYRERRKKNEVTIIDYSELT